MSAISITKAKATLTASGAFSPPILANSDNANTARDITAMATIVCTMYRRHNFRVSEDKVISVD